jgi:hypothetical protein
VKWVAPVLHSPEEYKPCTRPTRDAPTEHLAGTRERRRPHVVIWLSRWVWGCGRHIAGTFPMMPDPDDPRHAHLPSFEQWVQIFRNSIPAFR